MGLLPAVSCTSVGRSAGRHLSAAHLCGAGAGGGISKNFDSFVEVLGKFEKVQDGKAAQIPSSEGTGSSQVKTCACMAASSSIRAYQCPR